ncbi:hypothetical protein EJ04DRAFT_511538 [Polyplosphaeria fusca]|uniref:Uncharacterized protein n=1 Tax=Polyplosphaeria fusca TaxID=682080 RepID=A0A9P4R2Y9_9PLEO|nr:hypothetical protein EJ04DRAFT_511538 [Polyplosphaeria fusca]
MSKRSAGIYFQPDQSQGRATSRRVQPLLSSRLSPEGALPEARLNPRPHEQDYIDLSRVPVRLPRPGHEYPV